MKSNLEEFKIIFKEKVVKTSLIQIFFIINQIYTKEINDFKK